MNDFSFMGLLLDLGSYLQAHLWHSSLVFQQSWEEDLHSFPCWAQGKPNNKIWYFTLSHNLGTEIPSGAQAPAVAREEDHGAEHGSSPGMGGT